MSTDKPKNIDEYRIWFKEKHGVQLSHKDQIYYESVTSKLKRDFEQSKLWVELTNNLQEYDSQYLLQKHNSLWMPNLVPAVFIKPFASFELKTFRKNVLENKKWPDEPDGGWLIPDNWYSKINDIIRTLLVANILMVLSL